MVGNTVVVVVDFHLVQHVRIERKVIGTAGGLQKRIDLQIMVTLSG
jgi:hypothetical protein